MPNLLNPQDSNRAFSCQIKGCDLVFENVEDLDWHVKKHDIMLNLGFLNTKTSENADQTPTPTRFIRNCEEVGLFQDLQNVNPFDEVFKKALETSKKEGGLEVNQTQSDDTLHTPQIYPHVEQSFTKYPKETELDSPMVNKNTDHSLDGVAIAKSQNIKLKIRCALESKKNENHAKNTIDPAPNKKLKQQLTREERSRVREMNRAAQERCRKRKQNEWNNMKTELASLKKENQNLRVLNDNLRKQVINLQSIVLNFAKTPEEQQLHNPPKNIPNNSEKIEEHSVQHKLTPCDSDSKSPVKNITSSALHSSSSGNIQQVPQSPLPVMVFVTSNLTTVPVLSVQDQLQPRIPSLVLPNKNKVETNAVFRQIVPKNK